MKIFRIFVAILLLVSCAASFAQAQQRKGVKEEWVRATVVDPSLPNRADSAPAPATNGREERTMSFRFGEGFYDPIPAEEKMASLVESGAFNTPDGLKTYTSVGGQGERELFSSATLQVGGYDYFQDRNVVIRNDTTQELAWQLARIPGFGGYSPSNTISRLTYEDPSVQSAVLRVSAVVLLNDPAMEETKARGISSQTFILFRKDENYGPDVYQLGTLAGRQVSLLGEFYSEEDAKFAATIYQTMNAALHLRPYRTVKAQGGAVQP